jgi:hypothetical protein
VVLIGLFRHPAGLREGFGRCDRDRPGEMGRAVMIVMMAAAALTAAALPG